MNLSKLDEVIGPLQREEYMKIFNTFFDPDSEAYIYDLIGFLYSYDAIEDKQLNKLNERLDNLADIVWKRVNDFDKQRLKEINK